VRLNALAGPATERNDMRSISGPEAFALGLADHYNSTWPFLEIFRYKNNVFFMIIASPLVHVALDQHHPSCVQLEHRGQVWRFRA
jgi:hypothetical protein